MTYEDIIEWIQDNVDPDDYDSFREYFDAAGEEFHNPEVLDNVRDELEVIWDNA